MDNDLESSLGYIIGTTRRLVLKTLNEAFVKNNIPITIEQFVFLSLLKSQTGEVTQQDMACLTCKDKSAVLRTIDILEKKGLVQRLSVSGDRRKNILQIANCDRLFSAIMKIERQTMDMLTEGIAAEDIAAMMRGFEQIQLNANKNKTVKK